MYCINCGVRLADTQERCPLCGTVPFHPELQRERSAPLYPPGRQPAPAARPRGLCGAVLILFLIPVIVTFLVDLRGDRQLNWFGYVAGALALAYVTVALPLWFRRPNPIVFVPCGFAAAALYLLYIALASGGGWFLPFALPVTAGLGLIVTAAVVLFRCLKRGRLYVTGGMLMALGGWVLLVEFLLSVTFGLPFWGWSFYPLTVLILLGGCVIWLAISRPARACVERKLFF